MTVKALVLAAPDPASKRGVYLSSPDFLQLMAKRRTPSEEGAESFGHRLARFRKERGLSQVEVAERIGIAQPNLSGYERGEAHPSFEILVQLARVLQVSGDELLGLRPVSPQPVLKDRRLLKHMQQIERLPKRKKDALLVTIKAFLNQAA